MTYETIRVETDGPLTTITLNRPDRLNAMPPQMADEIGQVFYDLGEVRAVLITGEGKGFCSGADLAARGDGSALGSKGGSHQALSQHYNPAISQILRAEVPVICAVNGPAAGVGVLARAGSGLHDCGRAGLFSASLRQYRPGAGRCLHHGFSPARLGVHGRRG